MPSSATGTRSLFALCFCLLQRWAADFNLGIAQWGRFNPMPPRVGAAPPPLGQRQIAVQVLLPAAHREALLGMHTVRSEFRLGGVQGALFFDDDDNAAREASAVNAAHPYPQAAGDVRESAHTASAPLSGSQAGSGTHCLVRLVYVHHERCPEQLQRAHELLRLLTDRDVGFGRYLVGGAAEHAPPVLEGLGQQRAPEQCGAFASQTSASSTAAIAPGV